MRLSPTFRCCRYEATSVFPCDSHAGNAPRIAFSSNRLTELCVGQWLSSVLSLCRVRRPFRARECADAFVVLIAVRVSCCKRRTGCLSASVRRGMTANDYVLHYMLRVPGYFCRSTVFTLMTDDPLSVSGVTFAGGWRRRAPVALCVLQRKRQTTTGTSPAEAPYVRVYETVSPRHGKNMACHYSA